MQKYALFKYTPNLNHSFFELFLRIEAKVLNHKDVVEHKILDGGGTEERHAIIIFTRALEGRGHGRMHKGKEEEIQER